jgi:hypothetical protein
LFAFALREQRSGRTSRTHLQSRTSSDIIERDQLSGYLRSGY